MPDELTDRITAITVRLKSLAGRHKVMTEELESLRSENKILQDDKAELLDQVRQLEEQIFILKSSLAPLDEGSKKDFEKRINEYLRTINKCIALLKT